MQDQPISPAVLEFLLQKKLAWPRRIDKFYTRDDIQFEMAMYLVASIG